MNTTNRITKLNQHLEQLNSTGFTTQPVKAANCADVIPEFGRWIDVQRLFGIKRGTLYNLMADGKVKSVILRRKGNVHGCRLFYLKSISDYLHELMEEQNGQLVNGEEMA